MSDMRDEIVAALYAVYGIYVDIPGLNLGLEGLIIN
jgi:hypothetical protein